MKEQPVRTAFGLTCNVVRADTPSGFLPARVHPTSGEELFGEARIAGFAAMLRMGYVQNVVLLGGEDAGGGFHESQAIRDILMKEHGVDGSRIIALVSGYGTAEAVDYVAREASRSNAVVVSSFYHLPRIRKLLELRRAYFVPCMEAEALFLLEGGKEQEQARAQELLRMFGGGSYARRTVSEIVGIAHLGAGTYAPKGAGVI